MNDNKFSIEKLQPTDHADVWNAKFSISLPEEVSGVAVGQTAEITVRFATNTEGSVNNLLASAFEKLRTTMTEMTSFIGTNSLQELQERERDRAEALNKPFEFQFDPTPV